LTGPRARVYEQATVSDAVAGIGPRYRHADDVGPPRPPFSPGL